MKMTQREREAHLVKRDKPDTVCDIARRHGIKPQTLHSRLYRGMSLDEALATPVPTLQQQMQKAGRAGAAKRWGKR